MLGTAKMFYLDAALADAILGKLRRPGLSNAAGAFL